MQIFIPAIGTKLRLQQPWTFVYYHEYRNTKFLDSLIAAKYITTPLPTAKSYGAPLCYITLPVDTELRVSRVYIRQGGAAYESITFNLNIPKSPLHPKVTGRFWAKLDCVNKIQANVTEFRTTTAAAKAKDDRIENVEASIDLSLASLPTIIIDKIDF